MTLVLVRPDATYRTSWLAASEEYHAEGADRLGTFFMPPEAGFDGWPWSRERLREPGEFALMCAAMRAEADPDAPRPAGWVPTEHRWAVAEGEFLGSIALRLELTAELLEQGGHIGYAVRPSARRRGVATAALRLMLPVAAAYGLDRVLVTCDDDNVGSRRTIEANGGVLEDVRGVKRRYWITTG